MLFRGYFIDFHSINCFRPYGTYPLYVTVLAKTRHVRTKTEFNFIAAVYRHTQYLSIPSVSSVKC